MCAFFEKRACEMRNVSLVIRSSISCHMYMAHVCALFDEIYMNKKIIFLSLNIVLMESKIRYVMSYFVEWYGCRKTRNFHININVGKILHKGVMFNITYYIMHLGCIGFLGYCKCRIKTNHNIFYIPVLHANTSSLESHLSLMRWHHADTPAK